MITVQCNTCHRSYQVGDELAGRGVVCKNCKTAIRVPPVAQEKHDTWFDPNFDTCSMFMNQNYDLLQALLKQEREAPAVEVQTAG